MGARPKKRKAHDKKFKYKSRYKDQKRRRLCSEQNTSDASNSQQTDQSCISIISGLQNLTCSSPQEPFTTNESTCRTQEELNAVSPGLDELTENDFVAHFDHSYSAITSSSTARPASPPHGIETGIDVVSHSVTPKTESHWTLDVNTPVVWDYSTESKLCDSCDAAVVPQCSPLLPHGETINAETRLEPQETDAVPPLSIDKPGGATLIDLSKFPYWSASTTTDGVKVKLESRDTASIVQRSLFIPFNGAEVELYVHGHRIPKTYPSYGSLAPLSLASCGSKRFCEHILNCVKVVSLSSMKVCIGANDQKFKTFWKKEKNTFIDNNSFHETTYQETCRSKECHYLVTDPKKRCEPCNKIIFRFRNRKLSSCDETKTPSKFKPFSCLNSAEKEKRQKRSAKTIVNLMKKNKRLTLKLQALIEEESVSLDKGLSDEVAAALSDPKWDKIREQMGSDSDEEKDDTVDFFKIFIQHQLKAHDLKEKDKQSGMRWHPLLIRFALLIKTLSSSTYNALSQFIHLPSERTLFDYSHVYKKGEGVQTQFINELSQSLSSLRHDYQKYFVLMFDEIFIHSNLAVNKSTGEIVGYCKLTEVQSEVAELKNKLKCEAEGVPYKPLTTPPMAKRILSYMVKGTAGGGKSVVAYHTIHSLTKEDLFEYTWEVVENCEMGGIRVIAMIADGCEVNRAFFKMHPPFSPPSDLSPDVVFDTPNRYAPDRPIFFISDVPHAIKTARNCLENSGTKRHMTKNGEPLLWSTIVSLFNQKCDQTVKLLHKLSWDTVHLNSYSRMNVSYASRVLSNSVANALEFKKWPQTKELCIFKNSQ